MNIVECSVMELIGGKYKKLYILTGFLYLTKFGVLPDICKPYKKEIESLDLKKELYNFVNLFYLYYQKKLPKDLQVLLEECIQ